MQPTARNTASSSDGKAAASLESIKSSSLPGRAKGATKLPQAKGFSRKGRHYKDYTDEQLIRSLYLVSADPDNKAKKAMDISAVARDTGVRKQTLSRWLKKRTINVAEVKKRYLALQAQSESEAQADHQGHAGRKRKANATGSDKNKRAKTTS